MSVTYTDSELRNLVEEYITQQKSEFTFKGVCSYILYWAVEDGKVADGNNLIQSDKLIQTVQDKVMSILKSIMADGRIVATSSEIYKNKK